MRTHENHARLTDDDRPKRLLGRLSPGLRALPVAALTFLVSGSAQGQWLGHDYAVYGVPLSNYSSSSFLNQTYFNRSSLQRASKPGRAAAARTGARASTTAAAAASPGSGNMARELARNFPADHRVQIERAFIEAFSGYQKLEAKFGIPKHDVAGAVAAFIAGNYMAYRNTEFPDEHFRPLVEQVRAVLSSNSAFARASAIEKRRMYEQLAMVGTFMAVSSEALRRNPNLETERNFRQTAKVNLEQFLSASADSLAITDAGLVIH